MANLVGVLPQLAAAEQLLRARALERGITYGVADFGGLRSQADTTKILGYRDVEYKQYVAALKKKNPAAVPIPIYTWRPIKPFGTSYHNFGAAFDAKIISRPASIASDSAALAVLGSLAPACGLTWGGTFPKASLDPAHFQLAVRLDQARALWLAAGNDGPHGALASMNAPTLAETARAAIKQLLAPAPAPAYALPGFGPLPSLAVTPSRSSSSSAGGAPMLRGVTRRKGSAPAGAAAAAAEGVGMVMLVALGLLGVVFARGLREW